MVTKMITRHSNGQLKPLKDRTTPKRQEYLMEKREYRRLISLEHAKTRGMAQMAFNNTVLLAKYGKYGVYVYGVLWLALAIYVFTR